jgi:hypothetical protein
MNRHILKSQSAGLCALVVTLILPAVAAGREAPPGDAVRVFHCTFGEQWDVNYDAWPDRWIRKTGPDYPHYVEMGIKEDATAPTGRCLRIDLDGASAAVQSPPIRVMPRFSYLFTGQLKCEGIQHSSASVTLDFCDAKGRVLQTKRSNSFATTDGWTAVRIEAAEPSNAAIDRVVVGLQVKRATKGDLAGRVSLADVSLARLPRIAVSTNSASNVYTELDGAVVRCELSGITERNPEVCFQLVDWANNELQVERVKLSGQLIVDDLKRGSDVTDGVAQGPDCFEGTTEWRPKIPDYGFYRVNVKMFSKDEEGEMAERLLASRTICLAAAPPLPLPRRGEFGWTLPQGDAPLSFQELSRLLPQVGINWVKVPVWFDAAQSRRGDELIRFVELLGASNIEVVGIIDQPPANTELGERLPRNTSIAELLALESSVWAAALEPVMSRLSLRVRWWQLGRDYDTSFVGYPSLGKRINELRTALFRFGQDVRMGLNWDCSAPVGDVATWDFQQLCFDEVPTEQQFKEFLARPRAHTALRWVFVDVPRRGEGDAASTQAVLHARGSELVRRMVAAKVLGADAIIVSNPFHDEAGLMHVNGMPGELLLPWRTTAVMLAGAEYLGQIQLPEGSENFVFLRPDGQVVMVVWRPQPAEEILHLGGNVRQFDIYGRSSALSRRGREQVVPVGPVPSFVLGLHEVMTRWRMAVEFDKRQVPSIFKTPHGNALRFKNYFPQGVGGSWRIIVPQERAMAEASGGDGSTEAPALAPDRWALEPAHGGFQLSPGQEMKFPFDIRLKNALFGKQPVRIDFKVEADELFEFSVYRELEVGTEDLTLEVNSHLDNDGLLIIEQLMTNTADRLADFKCYLLAKGHRPQRMQVYRLSANVDRKVYRIPEGEKLVGQEMMLEIEELNGPRVLKYRFVATATAATDKPVQEVPAVRRGGDSDAVKEVPPLASFGS